MDGASFDRLSMVVHRLRDRVSRRGALRLLLGGSLVAATSQLSDDAEARRRRRNGRCRGYGGFCYGQRDCCSGNCINNHCFPGRGNGNGNGGRHCGGRSCPSGWRCCNSSGVSVCVPNSYPNCCGGSTYVGGYYCCGGGGGACPAGWDCCGGFNQCCGSNQFCCGNGQCCPVGWYCGSIACYANQDAAVAAQAAGSAQAVQSDDAIPFSAPVTVDPNHWISLAE